MSEQENSQSNQAILEELIKNHQRLPVNTYRLQFHKGFTFRDATDIIPYLSSLGITEIYSSPILKARKGSQHGYDIVDHRYINPELGTEEEFQRFIERCKEYDLRIILDFVPNHMAADPQENIWWRDVLEHGQASQYAKYFDIDWRPTKIELYGKVLLPILGDHYGNVLKRNELTVKLLEERLVIEYWEKHLPIDPKHIPMIFQKTIKKYNDNAIISEEMAEFLSIMTAYENLPANEDLLPSRIRQRYRESQTTNARFVKLLRQSETIRELINDALSDFNQVDPGQLALAPIHSLLEKLPYRLAFWKTAFHEINYRRFFDINDLASLRMEDGDVFRDTHQKIVELIKNDIVSGLRLDHVDGMYDPTNYIDQLQNKYVSIIAERELNNHAIVPAMISAIRKNIGENDHQNILWSPFYIAVEKILSPHEALRHSWAAHGTTGYDFLNAVNQLFIQSKSEAEFNKINRLFNDDRMSFDESVYNTKKLITQTALASELNLLAHQLNRISESHVSSRDFTLESLREALREFMACLSVYRTYISYSERLETDINIIKQSLRRARKRNPAMEATIFQFIQSILIPDDDIQQSSNELFTRLQFCMKLQQYCGPVQAKGVEDTTFYRYNRLSSLNEVGGGPVQFGMRISEYHDLNQQRLKSFPYSMLTTSTHDTKRSEDVRARINALSEIPELWQAKVQEWVNYNKSCKSSYDQIIAPHPNDEYLYYQSLIGTWPCDLDYRSSSEAWQEYVQRIQQYMIKAVKEAKLFTSWINPNEEYDHAIKSFIESTMDYERSNHFLDSVNELVSNLSITGYYNSLAQIALKATAPGVVDTYQGTELWDSSLVDPDNRRLVDYEPRSAALARVDSIHEFTQPDAQARISFLESLLDRCQSGEIKLYLLSHLLRLRRLYPDLFCKGTYTILNTEGDYSDNIIAYVREYEDKKLMVIVPRLIHKKLDSEKPLRYRYDAWDKASIELPPNLHHTSLRHRITNEVFDVSDGKIYLNVVLKYFPIAILECV